MNKDLINLIKSELKVDEAKAIYLANGLYDALGYHEQVGAIYNNPDTIKDYKTEIKSALGHIEKLNKALSNISPENRQVLDSIYYAANGCDGLMMNSQLTETASRFELAAHKMQKTLEMAQQEIANPGTGNARRQGKRYVAGIEMLARYFSESLPECQLSSSPNSIFYKYVAMWFSEIVKTEIHDVERHISNALERAISLSHVG